MPPSMLDSQLATLEEPTALESPWVCDIAETAETIVASLVARAGHARMGGAT
jgi:gluconate kinase